MWNRKREAQREERERKRLSRKLWRQVAGFPSFWPRRRDLSLLRHPDYIGSISKLRPSSTLLEKKRFSSFFSAFYADVCALCKKLTNCFSSICRGIDKKAARFNGRMDGTHVHIRSPPAQRGVKDDLHLLFDLKKWKKEMVRPHQQQIPKYPKTQREK